MAGAIVDLGAIVIFWSRAIPRRHGCDPTSTWVRSALLDPGVVAITPARSRDRTRPCVGSHLDQSAIARWVRSGCARGSDSDRYPSASTSLTCIASAPPSSDELPVRTNRRFRLVQRAARARVQRPGGPRHLVASARRPIRNPATARLSRGRVFPLPQARLRPPVAACPAETTLRIRPATHAAARTARTLGNAESDSPLRPRFASSK